MIIKYLDMCVKYAIRGKVQQSAKLSEWAHNEMRKKRGMDHDKTDGIR